MTGSEPATVDEPAVVVYAMTHCGCVRGHNEDAVGASRWSSQHTGGLATHRYSGTDAVLCVVADGVGGQPAGDVASALVVDSLVHDAAPQDTEALRERIGQLHRELLERGASDARLTGMATTVAVLVAGDTVLCANVGDTRIYDLSADGALAVSVDDSPHVPGRDTGHRSTIITQALGGTPDSLADPHVQWFARERDLVFLLCSDGLTNVVSDTEISAQYAQSASDAVLVRGLVELALQRGAPDNVTVLVARIDPAPAERAE